MCFSGTSWSALSRGRPYVTLPPTRMLSHVTPSRELIGMPKEEKVTFSPAEIIEIEGEGVLSLEEFIEDLEKYSLSPKVARNIKSIKITPKSSDMMLLLLVERFPNLEILYLTYNERLRLHPILYNSIKKSHPSLKVYVKGLPAFSAEEPNTYHTGDCLELLRDLHFKENDLQ
jgi:hypothetical protein